MRYSAYVFSVIAFVVVLTVAAGVSGAGEGHDVPPIAGSKELQKLKSLEGEWHGMVVEDGKEMPVTVVYETSSNGSVVVETLAPGTPHEMVSVYYDDGGKLSMTHYCAVGNQPHLTLDESGDGGMDLVFAGGSNIDPAKDGYMHGVSFEFDGSGKIVQSWTYFQGGKEAGTTSFTLTRAGQ
ncbi:MAG: hypothetical protein R3B51_01240 [Thermodesulfobacteriota bacterium]